MRGRLSLNGVILGAAGLAALLLTVTRPSPSGLIPFGMTDREARAAPGEPQASVKRKHNLTALKVFNRTLVRVRDSYVEPSRIDPKEMLYAALESVQYNIPEVLVNSDKSSDKVTVVVNDKKAVFSTKEVDSPWRLSGKLKRVFRFIEANMNPGADLARVEYAAVNGMLSTLDPHSVLLDPEMAREMDVSTSGKFGGLGIVIGMRKRKLTVIRPMKNTPAYEAGLKANDHIVKIGDEITENLTLSEAVDRMRGKPGSKVTLWVKRGEEEGMRRFSITRDIIRVPSVESQLLSKNVGYIRLKQFASSTAGEVKEAMDDLSKQGAKAWVIDLRGNPGGLLEQAIQVADLFVEAGTLVTTIGGGEREPRRAERKGTDTTSPIALLVNGSSASASEIVAGALKNLDRALVIGRTSFGKGSVQILYDNSDGSKLKLTIAEYLTPDNLSIQSLGIVPDIELRRMYVPKENKSSDDWIRLLKPSRSYREKDLKSHLDSKYAKNPPKPAMALSFLYTRPESNDADNEPSRYADDDEPAEDEFREDFEIKLARDLLSAVGDKSRKATLRRAKRLIQRKRTEETQRLSDQLAALGIDWSPAPGKQKPRLTATFELNGGKTELKAGDKVELVGTVTNNGSTAAHRVHARVRSHDGVFDDTELVFGKIAPGESRTWTSYLEVPEDALDRLDYLGFNITDASGAKRKAKPLRVRIRAAERPVFAYSHQLIDDGNGDGLVQAGEKLRLRVTVKNTGKGTAKETTAILRNASGDDVRVKKARFELGELKPGAETTVEFAFQTAARVKASEVVVEMNVYDSVLRESVAEKLKYSTQPASAGPTRSSGTVRVQGAKAALHEGASATSAVLGTAGKGSTFRVTGRLGEWVRVDLGKGRPAFVKSTLVRTAAAGGQSRGFRGRLQVTPPTVSLNVPTLESRRDSYTLRGTARDDSKVDDVYIIVSNRDAKIENRKVFYRKNRGTPSEMAFSSEIPLWPGSNAVRVVARENGEVRTSRMLYIYRHSDDGTRVANP